MRRAAESVSLEKEASSRPPVRDKPHAEATASVFDPAMEQLLPARSEALSESVAGSLSVEPLKAPVLQRAQRLYGNRASQQIVTRARILQRQCTCGGTCAICQEEEEQRALQRSSTSAAPAELDGIPATGGEPLDPTTRQPLETHFGADLADVRIHTGTEAARSASSLDALAYSSGRDIYFAAGMYAPTSGSGQRLLAHEVAHVIQQGSGKEPTLAAKSARGVKIGAPEDSLETEADLAAEGFMTGAPPGKLTDEEQRKRRESGVAQRYIQRQPVPTPAAVTPARGGVAEQPLFWWHMRGPAVLDAKRGLNLYQQQEQAVGRPGFGKDWRPLAEDDFVDDRTPPAIGTFQRQQGLRHQDSRLWQETLDALKAVSAATAPAASLGQSHDQRLIDLLDGRDWNGFFSEFNSMNEADQLRFLRDNFGAAAQITAHIGSAELGGNRDRLRYLLERAKTPASTGLYVDASVLTYRWQPKYRVEKPGELSRFVSFGDLFDVDLDINTIGDGELSDDEAEKQFREAQPGPGGFLWPAIRNRSTLPVLWQVKQDVHKQMETVLFDPVLAAGIMVVQYLLNVVYPFATGSAIRSLAALRRGSVLGRWMRGASILKGAARKVVTDAEAFTQARNARNTMVDAYNEMLKAQRETIAVVTGGVNVETGQVAGGYNTAGKCAEDMVVERLGGDASKVKFSEAVRPRTGQQQPVCLRCQGKYAKEQFPEGVIFGGPGVTMPGVGQ